MRNALLIVFGLVVAAVAGLAAWVLYGDVAAAAVAVGAVALAIWATRLVSPKRGWAVAGLVVLLVAAIGLVGWQAAAVARALGDRSGPVAEPDQADLAAATEKLEGAGDSAGFRLELEERELTALVQEALSEADTPLGEVAFDVDESEEVLRFDGSFRSGDLEMSASISLTAELGGVVVELVEADIGQLALPGTLAGAIDDIISGVADFQGALAGTGASVQSIEYTETSLILVGTSRSGEVLTSEGLLDTLASQTAELAGAVDPPPERLGPGRVNGTSADGPTYYVALGDSLSANVGVDQARDGYVSRFHAEVERRDGATYGLRNFGISGETSGSLLNGGQLTEALGFMANNPSSYVTIDIGANDLLGHMGSPDCGDDLTSPACQDRIEDTLATYEATLSEILDRITEAAPDATVVFLQTYNPFSLGMASFVEFEQRSDETVQRLNQVAAGVAAAKGVLVADGFTPMQGTAAATTHMTESPADIHPRAIGFDILAFALVEALE